MTTQRNALERRAIVEDVTGKLMAYGVGPSFPSPAIQELFKILKEYENLPDDATSGFSGRIPFPEIERDIEYKFPLRKANEAYVRMVPRR